MKEAVNPTQTVHLSVGDVTRASNVFPELNSADYRRLRDQFSKLMIQRLDEYDQEINWSDRTLTPLEAEVEIDTQHGARTKIHSNLTAAIRRDYSSKSFLVVGDPGSGKSVSMRRLAREMYLETATSGVVPIYINMREWVGPNEPNDLDLYKFIVQYITNFAGAFGTDFIIRYFMAMVGQGKWLFILDSFDEVPSVLDCDDGSDQLRNVSKAFDRFSNDLHQCKTVLASRPFRQPIGFRGRRITIRPFRESQVRRAMKTWLAGSPLNPAKVVKRLFSERPELAALVRNPFTADLIAKYIVQTNGQIPPNYVAIFDAHMDRILGALRQEQLNELGVSREDILVCAVKIAFHMFRGSSAFEMDVDELQIALADPKLSDKVEAMRISRLARIGGLVSKRFSFVHRRFAEFFAVRGLIESRQSPDLQSIPSDSRWRDALVVYCGIAPNAAAYRIANFCWEVILKGPIPLSQSPINQAKPTIHCLRFLKDAFRARPECLTPFQEDLTVIIIDCLASPQLLANWIGAECIPLIAAKNQASAITEAFRSNNKWIADTALRSCRHFSKIGIEENQSIRRYIESLSTIELFTKYYDLKFSFSLCDELTHQGTKLTLDAVGVITLWLLLATLVAHGVGVLAVDTHFTSGALSLIVPACAIFGESLVLVTDGRILNLWNSGKWICGYRRPICAGLRFGALLGILFASCAAIVGRHLNLALFYMLSIFIIIRWEKLPSFMLRSMIWTPLRLLAFLLCGWLVKTLLVSITKSREWPVDELANTFFSAIHGSSISPIIVYIILFLMLISVLQKLLRVLWLIKSTLSRLSAWHRDKNIVKKLAIPARPTRDWVIGYCRNLESEAGRIQFLLRLHSLQLTMTGDPAELPNEAWVTPSVEEAIVRLEIQWQGVLEN